MMCLMPGFPLVAIVTPVYNGEVYLAETMMCVQALDYPNLVHVILDNASTDATPEIIARYTGGPVPILTARNPSTIPMAANFNAALKLLPAETAYFRLLCADDLMTTDSIRRQVELAERHPDVAAVGCLEYCLRLRGQNIPQDQEIFDGKVVARAYLREENTVFSGTHFLFRSDSIDKFQPFYDETLLPYIDAEAALRACLHRQFAFIHDGLAIRRVHANNAYEKHARMGFTYFDYLQVLIQYGPILLDREEYNRRLVLQKRQCIRQLLRLRWRDGDRVTFNSHLKRLKVIGQPANWADFTDALGARALPWRGGESRAESVGIEKRPSY